MNGAPVRLVFRGLLDVFDHHVVGRNFFALQHEAELILEHLGKVCARSRVSSAASSSAVSSASTATTIVLNNPERQIVNTRQPCLIDN